MLPPTPKPTAENRPVSVRSGGVGLIRLILVIYWAGLAALTHWPRLLADDLPPPEPTDLILLVQTDKLFHIGFFGTLNVLLIRARLFGSRHAMPGQLRLSTLVALGYAAIDEWTQGWSAERTVSAGDMLANALGILAVYLWFAGVPVVGGKMSGLSAHPGAYWRRFGPGVGLLVLCMAVSFWRVFGDAMPGHALAGGLSFAAAAVWWLSLQGRSAGPKSRWGRLSGVVIGLMLVGLVIEAARMINGQAISFGYLFAHHLGVLLLVGLLAVLADRGAKKAGLDSDRPPSAGR
ncbi:MAG: VanZ family protein [Planctomycetota bacterium]